MLIFTLYKSLIICITLFVKLIYLKRKLIYLVPASKQRYYDSLSCMENVTNLSGEDKEL